MYWVITHPYKKVFESTSQTMPTICFGVAKSKPEVKKPCTSELRHNFKKPIRYSIILRIRCYVFEVMSEDKCAGVFDLGFGLSDPKNI